MFDLNLHLHPFFMCGSSEGSDESEYSLIDNAISTKISCRLKLISFPASSFFLLYSSAAAAITCHIPTNSDPYLSPSVLSSVWHFTSYYA